jgi:hypothetical protein
MQFQVRLVLFWYWCNRESELLLVKKGAGTRPQGAAASLSDKAVVCARRLQPAVNQKRGNSSNEGDFLRGDFHQGKFSLSRSLAACLLSNECEPQTSLGEDASKFI